MKHLPIVKHMVEKFQCPGCVYGHNTDCGKFETHSKYPPSFSCKSHVLGTMLLGWRMALGLPKGFCRSGAQGNQMDIRLWAEGTKPEWDRFNVAVWAMKHAGHLFVRTYSPRINNTSLDVIQSGTLDMCPGAINVGEFIDEMD